MIPDHLIRQSDAVPMAILKAPVTIIGAGAIGGFSAFFLARMGFDNLTVIDFDDVEPVNFSSQIFRQKDIGRPKTEALCEIIKDFTGIEIVHKKMRYETGHLDGLIITAVDSMAVRRAVFESHESQAYATDLIIDPRMSLETALMYTYVPTDKASCASYEKTLYSDSEAAQERCTGKATMYTVGMISGVVARTVRDFLVDKSQAKSLQWNTKVDDIIRF